MNKARTSDELEKKKKSPSDETTAHVFFTLPSSANRSLSCKFKLRRRPDEAARLEEPAGNNEKWYVKALPKMKSLEGGMNALKSAVWSPDWTWLLFRGSHINPIYLTATSQCALLADWPRLDQMQTNLSVHPSYLNARRRLREWIWSHHYEKRKQIINH